MSNLDLIWRDTQNLPTLQPNEAQIWRIDLADDLAPAGSLLGLLSADERERASRFRRSPDSSRFVRLRGILRILLAAHLGIRPEAVRFVYGPQGKPSLDPAVCDADLYFNLSHTHGIALIAVARGQEVGIDVERIRPGVARVAARFFSAEEVADLQALEAEERERAFFTAWVRKEAFVKARGEGISGTFNRFAVSLGSTELPSLRWVAGLAPRDLSIWTLYDLAPIPDHAAALAAAGTPLQLRCWRWPPRSLG